MPGSSGFDGSLKFNTELDNDGFDRDSNKLLSAVTDLTRQINHLGLSMQQSFSGITSILQELAIASRASASGMNDSAHRTAMAGAEAAVALENATTSTDQMSTSQTEQMAATDGAARSMEQMSAATDGVTQATQEATTAQTQVAEAADKMSSAQTDTEKSTSRAASAVNKYDKEIEKLQSQIAAAEAALSEYYDKLNYYTEMMDRAEATKGVNWQEDIQSANMAIDALEERYAAELADLDTLERKLAQVNAERNAALNAQNDSSEDDVGERAGDAASRVAMLKNALTGLGRVMDVVANTVLKLTKHLAQMAFRGISSGIKRATSGLKSFSRQANKTTLASNGLVKTLTSLKRLLITRIKRMFISKIFKDVQQGIQQLAKFDKAFDEIMSKLKNNATRLGGNVAVLIGNLIKTVEPVITTIINLLNTAITAVNRFYAAISGKSTYTAAKMGTEDYAKSVDNAAKSQKKLNAELYGFDELTRQQKKDDDEPSIQYETQNVDLPTGVLDWINRLKLSWEKGDWQGLGETIADGLNEAMQVVGDWINNKFRPWAVKWVGRIVDILCGAVKELAWELLGKSIANGINAAFAIVNAFLSRKDFFLSLGEGIGRAIKSWFDNIEWDLVAQTFANKWNALMWTLKNIVTTPGFWESVGTSIATFIRNWFATIDLDAIVDVVVGILNGIPKAINQFLAQNPFEGVPESLSSAINRVIHEVDWPGLIGSLGALFMGLLNTLHDVVMKVDWQGLGVKLGDAFASIDWWGALKTFAETLWVAFKGTLEGLFSTENGRAFLKFVAGLLALKGAFALAHGAIFLAAGKFIAGAVAAPIVKALTSTLPAAISGTAPAITGAITGLGAALISPAVLTVAAVGSAIVGTIDYWAPRITNEIAGVGDAVINELNTALSSYKRLFAEKGPEIANQWAQTCYQINTEGMSLEEAGVALAHRIEELSGTTIANVDRRVVEGLNGVTYDTSSMLQIYSDMVDQHGIDAANSWFEMVSGIKLFNDDLCMNQKETNQMIAANMEAVSEWARRKTDGTLSEIGISVGTGMAGINSTTSRGMDTLHGTADRGMAQVKAAITGNMLQAGNEVKRQNWSEVGTGVTEGIHQGMQSRWDWLRNAVSSLARNLLQAAKNALGINSPSKVFSDIIGAGVTEGWALGMDKTKGNVLETVSNISKALVNEAADGATIHTQLDASMDGTISGMRSVIDSLSDVALTFKTIADTLTAMGGLTMPQIAAGTVVPYKTKVAATSPAEDEYDGYAGHLSNIEASLGRLIEYLQSNGNSQIVVKLLLDGREVYQTVVDENNRQIQRTGASAIRV